MRTPLEVTPDGSGDDRADTWAAATVARMSLPDKIKLVDGRGGFPLDEQGRVAHPLPGHDPASNPPPGAVGTDGYTPAQPAHGIPALHLCGAGVGLTDMYGQRGERGTATVFCSPAGQSASWDPEITEAFGRALAHEARAAGVNVLLGGACNLAVEPWCGRLFEYHGEDPLLAGVMVAGEIRGCQEAGVLASLKHYAANFCETGRFFVDTVIDERVLRHGELRVFETALAHSEPAAVMAAYNKINGTYACEHDELINQILKDEWGYEGWVMSDWGATHSTVASALAGLDQEFPMGHFFGASLATAVAAGQVPQARLDDMCHRILRQAYALRDAPTDPPDDLDVASQLAIAERIARRSIVLLRNDGVLPLDPERTGTLLLVGEHADRGVLSGGGSGSVRPRGGDPVNGPDAAVDPFRTVTWVPSSPLAALGAALPGWTIIWRSPDERDVVEQAARADTVVIMATQHTCEGRDQPSLALDGEVDAVIEQLASVNDRVVVVLQHGGPVLTPWRDSVAAILAAWYPGHRGAEAIAAVLAGAENPSAKLPMTFPATQDQLVHPRPPSVPVRPGHVRPDRVPPHGDFSWVDEPYELRYDQPSGYQWFDSQGLTPAFCFGHGLSYTNFAYDGLTARHHGGGTQVRFTLTNRGARPGREICQVYAGLPERASEPPRRLVAWASVPLEPGEAREIELEIPPERLAVWDVAAQRWRVEPGQHRLWVGRSSRDLPLQACLTLDAAVVPPLRERRVAGTMR